LSDYIQDIDPSNTINGRPIYYLVNSANIAVPSDAGYVAVINSTNVLVQHGSFEFNVQNILVVRSRNVTVRDSNFTYVFSAITALEDENLTIANNVASGVSFRPVFEIDDSSGGNITGNILPIEAYASILLSNSTRFNIEGNYISNSAYAGIDMRGSTNNSIVRNTILGCTVNCLVISPRQYGIHMGPPLVGSVGGNLIVGNTIANNLVGLAESGGGNVIYQNNFIDNQVQVEADPGNVWNNAAGQGNYWSDYTGQDLNNDGVGDTMLPHLGLDNHPLISPWTPSGLDAKLAGRAAWPQYRRLDTSKVSGGIQTMYATANNTGTASEWVQAIFNITTPTGSTIQLVSQMQWVQPKASVNFAVTLPVFPGSYSVSVTVRFSSDTYLGWTNGNSKTFSFRAI
jgi:parallel beta-helix repeat protein